ncbi:hypothetical protein F5883DRAFT_439922 [Diaporthe sp. PMI_573]|nr:hypothetical protein F5883DRAFT_439922 [Diaporthaceae sp. PMI_573]
MDLFAFPIEIRLKIYSELLVHCGPIYFPATFGGGLSSWLCPEGIDLCPALLRASKQVYGEAVSLLYSDNCFRFSLDAASTQCHTTIAVFVRQIGAQASLLRHVCIGFPTAPLVEDYGHGSELQEVRLNNLDLLRYACPGITTLELSLRADFVLRNSPVFTESLDLIDTRLESFQSLREVRVDVKLLDWDSDEESDDGTEDPEGGEQEDPRVDRWKIHRDSVTRQLCNRGWAVNITKVPRVKEVWVSPDDMFEFDNEDDYNDYMIEWNRREDRLEREREEEESAEYYREKQLEGYRRGYADDGGPA